MQEFLDLLNSAELQGVVIVIAILVVLAIVRSMIRTVNEYERLVIFRLGSYRGIRGPGLTFVLPFIEGATKVDQRERYLDIPQQTAITKDNASIGIDFLVYYRITEPSLAIIKVESVVGATANIATTTLRAVIGDISLDDVLSKREQINDILRVKLDEITERWGMKITSVEIREISPPKAIEDAMNRQMSAERERRAEVTRAEGERSAAITVAEGHKQAAILKAEGEKEARILEAEGERQSQLLRAQGYADSLAAIYEQAKDIDTKTMALQYMDMLGKIGSSPSTKFVIPMELTSMIQNFVSNMSMGTNMTMPTPSKGNGHAEQLPAEKQQS